MKLSFKVFERLRRECSCMLIEQEKEERSLPDIYLLPNCQGTKLVAHSRFGLQTPS